MSVDFGRSFDEVTGALDSAPVSVIEVSVVNPDRIYVGTGGGRVFRSDNGGWTWTFNLAGARFAGREVKAVRADPTDEDRLFVGLGGFGRPSLYVSEDGGWRWQALPAKNLPDLPLGRLELGKDRRDGALLAVAGDAGVWVSDDHGSTFRNVSGTLPNVPVTDLVYHGSSGTWTAATFGRGLWRIDTL